MKEKQKEMSPRIINQFSNVELLEAIKKSKNKLGQKRAKIELDKRNLSASQFREVQDQLVIIEKHKKVRKEQPLSRKEFILFLIIPFFIPHPRWRDDDHTTSEMSRFEMYGFEKKAKQARLVMFLGVVFRLFVVTFLILFFRII